MNGDRDDLKPEERTENERDDKYVLKHVRAVSVIPNQIRMTDDG